MRSLEIHKRNVLGYGLIAPMRRLASSDFVAAEGESLVRSAIMQVLGTRPGELPWRPDFGIDLEYYRQKNATGTLSREVAEDVSSALQTWEPRIEIASCQVSIEAAEPGLGAPRNVIRIKVSWLVRTDAISDNNNVLIGPVSQEVAI